VPKIAYQQTRFSASSLEVIERANSILEEYAVRPTPIILTLRQLYYQFVARDWIDNNQKEYKRLGKIINDARMAGLIDWDHLRDRTRNLSRLQYWEDPGGVIETAASYHRDLWEGQDLLRRGLDRPRVVNPCCAKLVESRHARRALLKVGISPR
jgi:hypothetical protein